jgi:cell division protein FtsB
MIKYLNSRYGIVVVVCIIVSMVIYSCFSERGLLKVFSLKSELKKMEALNDSIRLENEECSEYIHLLNEDTRYIEKKAREELGLLKEGEMVYFFKND